MPRYFLEVSYMGSHYSGFQVQENANSVQEEVEKALAVFLRKQVILTGSSRTDTGVHALQNFFHMDLEEAIASKALYNVNAMLPQDIVLRKLYAVASDAHCRFDARSREYHYHVYQQKDPFLMDRAYYYPYKLDLEALQSAAALVLKKQDFTSFSKRNTQSKTPFCEIQESNWLQKGNEYVYQVRANRFLRGMVRGLAGTMLQVGRKKMSLEQFEEVFERRDCSLADFSVPGHGLFLVSVIFPENLLKERGE
jgi:tRNA pseudouridine38-40 synthase